MIRFERTFDAALVRQAIAHPRTYRSHCCDGSPDREAWQPNMGNDIWYVAAWENETYLGVFMFVPHNPILWEVHTCLMPIAWGDRARECALSVAKWIWKNTPCEHIKTYIPDDNPLAVKFAHAAGMRIYGEIPRSFPRNGIVHAQLVMGIMKVAA